MDTAREPSNSITRPQPKKSDHSTEPKSTVQEHGIAASIKASSTIYALPLELLQQVVAYNIPEDFDSMSACPVFSPACEHFRKQHESDLTTYRCLKASKISKSPLMIATSVLLLIKERPLIARYIEILDIRTPQRYRGFHFSPEEWEEHQRCSVVIVEFLQSYVAMNPTLAYILGDAVECCTWVDSYAREHLPIGFASLWVTVLLMFLPNLRALALPYWYDIGEDAQEFGEIGLELLERLANAGSCDHFPNPLQKLEAMLPSTMDGNCRYFLADWIPIVAPYLALPSMKRLYYGYGGIIDTFPRLGLQWLDFRADTIEEVELHRCQVGLEEMEDLMSSLRSLRTFKCSFADQEYEEISMPLGSLIDAIASSPNYASSLVELNAHQVFPAMFYISFCDLSFNLEQVTSKQPRPQDYRCPAWDDHELPSKVRYRFDPDAACCHSPVSKHKQRQRHDSIIAPPLNMELCATHNSH